jgi:Uma2 family endonuclease
MAVSTLSVKPGEPPKPEGEILPLENGDRLTRPEFERRYDAMPHLKKAELIEGEVYVPSPVQQRRHSRPHIHLSCWLGYYEANTPGVEAGDNGSVRLDLDNMPQPDCLLFVQPEHGGRVKISDDDYIEGAPELVGEVSSSTASLDLGKKLHVYRRNGVLEYVVWRVRNREIDWFVLRDGQYERLAPGPDGILRSTVFPGLWLDATALLRGELATVLAVVQRGVTEPEHAQFVARLAQAHHGAVNSPGFSQGTPA